MERRFPVLYWLHGSGGGLAGVPPIAAHFDAAIRRGRFRRCWWCFPTACRWSMWCDSKDGSVPMETIVIKELLPHVDATFRTIATREGRIIEGFSMGGYGEARLGFRHHALFAAVSMLGAGPLQRDFKEAPPRTSRARSSAGNCVRQRPGVLPSPKPVADRGAKRRRPAWPNDGSSSHWRPQRDARDQPRLRCAISHA